MARGLSPPSVVCRTSGAFFHDNNNIPTLAVALADACCGNGRRLLWRWPFLAVGRAAPCCGIKFPLKGVRASVAVAFPGASALPTRLFPTRGLIPRGFLEVGIPAVGLVFIQGNEHGYASVAIHIPYRRLLAKVGKPPLRGGNVRSGTALS